MPRVRSLLPLPKQQALLLRCLLFFVCAKNENEALGECRGVRVSCGDLCIQSMQKRRPSRQARPSPSAPAKEKPLKIKGFKRFFFFLYYLLLSYALSWFRVDLCQKLCYKGTYISGTFLYGKVRNGFFLVFFFEMYINIFRK